MENNFNISDELEIFVVTYNRKKKLEKTLLQIFSANSPIKNCRVIILDNKSFDGTNELIENYYQKYKNLTHIIHNRNIGGNGNIARAMELASKKYFWILCDDDDIDFKYWNEIETGIQKNHDAILTERKTEIPNGRKKIPYILNTLAFVPAAIYKTSNLTDDVMQNAMANIMYSFPHLALGCSLINNSKTFYVPQHTILKQNVCFTFKRGFKKEKHFRLENVNIYSGYINSFQMINDKQLRKECCEVLYQNKSFYYSMREFWKNNKFCFYNICDIWNGISCRQKIVFFIAAFPFINFKNIVIKWYIIMKYCL